MKIIDKISKILGTFSKVTNERELHPLDPAELRMIANARVEQLAEFARSPRLHGVDPKGDSPLHLAARMGNLALCDLFVRSGADPRAKNHDRHTPADVASSEGHRLVAQLLFSLADNPPIEDSDAALAVGRLGHFAGAQTKAVRAGTFQSAAIEREEDRAAFGEPQTFEPEEDAERFFYRSAGGPVSGTFVALGTSASQGANDADVDWELDLSPTQIAGEGIGSEAAVTPDLAGDDDFLKVRRRGRRSIKPAALPSSTRLSIAPECCLNWATEILEKGYFCSDDVDALISFCEGNGDSDELRSNLLRILDAAGLESFDEAINCEDALWDIRSDISADDLAEALESACSRATRLPGTSRFNMDKAIEARLLEPLLRAKRDLQLGILACEPAVHEILANLDKLIDGSVQTGFVTMRPIVPSRPDEAETAAFFKAGQALRYWNLAGRVMDGRRRREALEALEALDLSLVFHNALVGVLAEHEHYLEASRRLDAMISAIERLIIEHLPYARRFAARNVEAGEDPEDVFQVAFMGLQRSTLRFDPERGYRFVIYATFWMKQVLTRWRADEGAIVRIPMHRHQKLAKLDEAVERLEGSHGRPPTESELAEELGWDLKDVKLFLDIPRHYSDLEGLEQWEGAISGPEQEEALGQVEAARIISEALAELPDPDRQAEVIRMRYGIGRDRDMTLEEIGQIYRVTRERIRQIEAMGLEHLSHPRRKRRLQTLMGL
ncbi:sigma-70 family RNA polymerase sigma factor [Methylocella tundrae]|uniref:RNA polymerase sigma factor n=1 Tax=Methylocella tundrae TaxID=227605 RepID=A0A4U8Z0H7_METTU|nr:sigma-70 family RNA polymerase sigma factor [Methylocella tundrae]WPP06203.1 sigma-70 family RNA polymerase sigma factor [Methylocella tundrae]VFU08858.1 RNA polymerase sigma factor [Methylocella tundrae]